MLCNCRLNQDLRAAIKRSEAAFADFIAATETRALEYSGCVGFCARLLFSVHMFGYLKCCRYGKRFIMTKNFSPDAFMQVAFQCAYRFVCFIAAAVFRVPAVPTLWCSRVYGEVVNTYETVMTKKFLHARTEAGRCTTAAIAKFCKVR
jgi:carnitine O-acetyltransferase